MDDRLFGSYPGSGIQERAKRWRGAQGNTKSGYVPSRFRMGEQPDLLDPHFGAGAVDALPPCDPTRWLVLSGAHKSILTEGDLIDFAINESFDFG
jgi:hypothetical protein